MTASVSNAPVPGADAHRNHVVHRLAHAPYDRLALEGGLRNLAVGLLTIGIEAAAAH